MSSSNSQELLERIHAALEAARAVLNRFTPGAIETEYKVGHDPVTEADRAVDDILRKTLLRAGGVRARHPRVLRFDRHG